MFTQVVRNQDKIELGFATEGEIELHISLDVAEARRFAQTVLAATAKEVIFA